MGYAVDVLRDDLAQLPDGLERELPWDGRILAPLRS